MGIYFLFFLECIFVIWGAISFAGFINYKYLSAGKIKSWEDGIKDFFISLVSLFTMIYRLFSEKEPPEEIINPSLILSSNEVIELIKLFANHPYDTPSLETYEKNSNGIMWLDITAVSFTSEYRESSFEDLSRMAKNHIQNYYLETRAVKVTVYIKVITPKRLYFAIPLSESGKSFLEKQREDCSVSPIPEVYDVLEEEIDLFLDEDDLTSWN